MAKLKINQRFGITPNELLNREDLSLKAKGLFAFIQSKPDDWNFSAERICLQTKDGIDSVSSALKELEKAGYLKRKKSQDTNGFWDIEYTLYEKPTLDFPRQENPRQEKPSLENHPNNSKKDLSKKDIGKKTKNSEQGSQDVSLLIKEFERIDIKNKTYYGNKTQRAKVEFLLENFGFERVVKVIDLYLDLKSKNFPYLPSITSPYDMVEKWEKLKEAITRQESKQNFSANVIW
jgi:hypothetical protein